MLKAAADLISHRAQRWALRRQGLDSTPLTVDQRRTYILPTPLGIVYGLMVFTMLLGSMNYNNSMGLALTFLLAALGLVAMHHCHRNLSGSVIRFARADPVFAGQAACFRIVVENPSAGIRYELGLRNEGKMSGLADIAPAGRAELRMKVPTSHRGRVVVERFNISTFFPFGLFRSWTWVHLPVTCIVYPRPAADSLPSPPDLTDTGGAQNDVRGDEDFAGLRTFRDGDSPRQVAWKAFAKGQGLHVKQYAGTAVTTHRFDWDSLPMLAPEERLAQLCRWIVDAHRDGQAFGLRLPHVAIEPNIGAPHLERCLTELALFPADVR